MSFEATVIPAAVFDTNCYVLAAQGRTDALIVDPGIGVTDALERALAVRGWSVGAILLTHGHVDHVESVGEVQAFADTPVPVHIHREDRYRMDNPWRDIGPQLSMMITGQMGGLPEWEVPEGIQEFEDGDVLELAGFSLTVAHAPGHTQGSCLFVMDAMPEGWAGEEQLTILSGDVLFAGSVGRTDLPGGDPVAMERSLREVVLAQRDDALVLPGHGPTTTIGQERRTNPFLQVS